MSKSESESESKIFTLKQLLSELQRILFNYQAPFKRWKTATKKEKDGGKHVVDVVRTEIMWHEGHVTKSKAELFM